MRLQRGKTDTLTGDIGTHLTGSMMMHNHTLAEATDTQGTLSEEESEEEMRVTIPAQLPLITIHMLQGSTAWGTQSRVVILEGRPQMQRVSAVSHATDCARLRNRS